MRDARAAVAVGAVLLALACAGLMVKAGRRAYETLGPSHALAAHDGSLYVVSHGKLHVFAPDGRRTQVVDLAAIGAPVKPSDIALHADGRIVLADPDTSLLRRCHLPSGPCESLDLGLTRSTAQAVLPLNAAKVSIDEAAQRYYVSDNAGFRVVIADFSGRVLAVSPRGAFRHPNRLYAPSAGELSVIDTDRERIVTYDVRGDRFGRLLREVRAGADAFTRPGRMLPFDSAPMADGETAVLIGKNHIHDADLVVFDAHDRPARRIDLGQDSDPFDIERWGDRLVVADGANYRLLALSFDGRGAEDFPPGDFARELAGQRESARDWIRIRTAARVGLMLVPLLAALLLWRLDRRAARGASIMTPSSRDHPR